MQKIFTGDFTQQAPLPQKAIDLANDILHSARLHRYNLLPDEIGQTSLLEEEFARWQGCKYVVAMASGGQSMQIGLRAIGVEAGDVVLTNAFTLAPVPGAIKALNAEALLVETTEELRLDLLDFEKKAKKAQFLLLSHMRGHLADMDKIVAIARDNNVRIAEDCAHTMGAEWKGTKSGNFGDVACFSTQTYKHINSGEGGLLSTNDPLVAAKAIIYSGSYMNYERHGARPSEKYFEEVKLHTPNLSARMDHLRAAILRPQLECLDKNIDDWNARYDRLADTLAQHEQIKLPQRPKEEKKVGSSLQFRIVDFDTKDCKIFLQSCLKRGVELKWFGDNKPKGFTSNHHSWKYMSVHKLPKTDEILSSVFDIRLPLSFSLTDCELIGEILIDVLVEMKK